jgi:CheY-like chemotaxis protein
MLDRDPTVCTSRILVANDDPLARKMFVRDLQSAGYAVGVAGSERTSLDILRKVRFHVLVFDLDMPGNRGFAALKTIRSEMPYTKVLVISKRRELLAAARLFGAVGAVTKVSAPLLLVGAVKRLVVDS